MANMQRKHRESYRRKLGGKVLGKWKTLAMREGKGTCQERRFLEGLQFALEKLLNEEPSIMVSRAL